MIKWQFVLVFFLFRILDLNIFISGFWPFSDSRLVSYSPSIGSFPLYRNKNFQTESLLRRRPPAGRPQAIDQSSALSIRKSISDSPIVPCRCSQSYYMRRHNLSISKPTIIPSFSFSLLLFLIIFSYYLYYMYISKPAFK